MAFLTKQDQLRIDAIIDSLAQNLGAAYPQDSLIQIANKAGIKVVETDLHLILPELSGAILYEDPGSKSKPTIYIHHGLTPSRKRFTLAHELGHHFLHESDKLRLDNLDYSKDDQDTFEESEANYFAASLLVPKSLLRKMIEKGMNTQELAEYFQVSIPVIRNRIKWIKIN